MGEVVELHGCPIEGCSTQIPKNHLMCKPHWRMVPSVVARLVLRTWDLFRTTRDPHEKPPARRDYLLAKARAVQEVNAKVMDRITRPPEDSCVPCDTEMSS